MTEPTPALSDHAEISKWWWLPLLQGMAALALAVALLASPLKTLVATTYWLGLYWLVDGVLNAIRALRGDAKGHRVWLLLAGAVGVLAGAAMMMHPALASVVSLNFMVALFAASMLANGVILMVAGRSSGWGVKRSRSWSSFLIGLLYVLGGVLLFMNPGMTVLTLMYLFVFWAMLVGMGLIVLAFEVKRAGNAA